jgi:uncharacterized PurR-regulated membrane protein YhhQ (DUF165 family)
MWTIAYIALIVVVNWLFVALPYFETPFGSWTVANLVVGFVFILRDMAQRELGARVLIATAFAGLLTYLTVDPAVALASVTAFMASEIADWGVYTATRKPLGERILYSSAVSTPLDTAIFQHMIGILTPAAFFLETLSKMAASVAVWWLLRQREKAAKARP